MITTSKELILKRLTEKGAMVEPEWIPEFDCVLAQMEVEYSSVAEMLDNFEWIFICEWDCGVWEWFHPEEPHLGI